MDERVYLDAAKAFENEDTRGGNAQHWSEDDDFRRAVDVAYAAGRRFRMPAGYLVDGRVYAPEDVTLVYPDPMTPYGRRDEAGRLEDRGTGTVGG